MFVSLHVNRLFSILGSDDWLRFSQVGTLVVIDVLAILSSLFIRAELAF